MDWTNRRRDPLHNQIPMVFDVAVARVVKAISRGSVLSYSQVALRAGKPGAARAVVRALHRLTGIPWWRVIRADGTLALEIAAKQAPLLVREGVPVRGRKVLRRRGVPPNPLGPTSGKLGRSGRSRI